MKSTLRFAEGFFLSSKAEIANVVSVTTDDNVVYRFTGTAKKLVEKIYAQTNYQEALEELSRLHPEQALNANEAFLKKFLSDLKEIGVLSSNE